MASNTPQPYEIPEGAPATAENEEPVLSVSSHVLVSAPAAFVFAIFCDTATWPEWNTFVPECGVVQGSASVEAASRATELHAGDELAMKVRMTPDASLRAQGGHVTEPVDAPDADGVYRICWAAKGMPKVLLRTMRTTEVVPRGDEVCEFRTWEFMAGPIAYVVNAMYAKTLQSRFEDCSRDIKAYAEEKYKTK